MTSTLPAFDLAGSQRPIVWLKRIAIFASLIGLVGAGYTVVMQRVWSGTAPAMVPVKEQADAIFVDKSDRLLRLSRNGQTLFETEISLGAAPKGHKAQEGDEKTPVGDYVIDWRNENSIAHLSLHISYPNAEDEAKAAERDVSAGGNIMIHGISNGWGFLGNLHRAWDWTNGCIAVTNSEMRKIWSLVPNGTPIKIVE